MTQSANYRTRAPKGVFFCASHEEMAADRLRWTIDLTVQRTIALSNPACLTAHSRNWAIPQVSRVRIRLTGW